MESTRSWWRRSLRGVVAVALCTLVVGAWAMDAGAEAPSGSPGPSWPASDGRVASVTAIEGSLSVQRQGQPRWYGGYVKMPDFVRDRLKTDTQSMAALDFVTGGRVGLGKGSEIEIQGDGQVGQVTGAAQVDDQNT